ncbi:MAG: hypothetical protein O3A49_04420 [Candidatus Marinimicrobia bacterium]|nr:hypothetical protein [Candidatus Neomarinimicrobiota bacterium]
MFSDDDMENISKKPDEVPDGVVDASDYYETLKSITNYLKDTEYEDTDSRLVAMMNIINLMHENEETLSEDNVYGVVISLMYHIQTIMQGMEEIDRQEYFSHIQENILPTFENESKALPYYDTDLPNTEGEINE